jgi:hypothetical protein
LPSAWLVTRLECTFSNPTVPFCATPTTTPGVPRPQTGVLSENMPPIQRALFFGMVTRGA